MIQAMKNLNLLKKWYVIDSQTTKDKYNKSKSIKFETESITSFFLVILFGFGVFCP